MINLTVYIYISTQKLLYQLVAKPFQPVSAQNPVLNDGSIPDHPIFVGVFDHFIPSSSHIGLTQSGVQPPPHELL